VPLDVPVLELDPGPVRILGDEPDLDLAGLGRVFADLPVAVQAPGQVSLEDRPAGRVAERSRPSGG
jgi:hypothetical protein